MDPQIDETMADRELPMSSATAFERGSDSRGSFFRGYATLLETERCNVFLLCPNMDELRRAYNRMTRKNSAIMDELLVHRINIYAADERTRETDDGS